MENKNKIAIYLFILRILRTFLNILILSLSAIFFGISIERDIWIIASTFILTINLAIWGPINETFRTKFIFLRELDGENKTLQKTGSLLVFITIITLLISVIIITYCDYITRLVVPSYQEKNIYLFTKILILLTPSFLITELTNIFSGLLNAYNHFYIPELLGLISGIVNFICIAILANKFGIYSLVIAQYISLFILLIFISKYLSKVNITTTKLFNHTFRWKDIRPFIIFSMPFFFPYFIGQYNAILEKSISNNIGDGVVSMIDYSKKFTDTLQAVLTSVLASVMVPNLATLFSKKNITEFQESLNEYLKIIFIILSITTPILITSSLPLNKILFLHGEMTIQTVKEMAILTRYYTLSFIVIALYLFFGLALLSQNQGKKYAIWGVIAQIIIILINISQYKTLGKYTFAISLFISHSIASLFMFISLQLENKKHLLYILSKYIILITTLTITVSIGNIYTSSLNPIIQLVINIFILTISLMVFGNFANISILHYCNKIYKKIFQHE